MRSERCPKAGGFLKGILTPYTLGSSLPGLRSRLPLLPERMKKRKGVHLMQLEGIIQMKANGFFGAIQFLWNFEELRERRVECSVCDRDHILLRVYLPLVF
ncbi:hypothetical protein CEXT_39421, partial [Caerostris extrusa]